MLSTQKIDGLLKRAEGIDAKLSEPLDTDTLIKLSRERAELEPIVDAIGQLKSAESDLDGLTPLLDDPELGEIAREEAGDLKEKIDDLNLTLSRLLLPKDAADEKSAIVEIRAGIGGNEAALFAGDLFRMYQRYADVHRWKMQVLDESPGDAGGYKEIIAEITGKGVFARLKFESGVHRVQRVPETEASGRVHTSAATVAVLPQAEEVDVAIRPEDIRLDTSRASSAGGQHANTTDSAVRLAHIPTGIVVTANEKSQHQNRARAMQILRARLFDLERHKQAQDRAATRRGQVGSRRSVRADSYLQFSTRAGDRPPDQSDAVQTRSNLAWDRARRDHRFADHRSSRRSAGSDRDGRSMNIVAAVERPVTIGRLRLRDLALQLQYAFGAGDKTRTPALDARLIVAHVLSIAPPSDLPLHDDRVLSSDEMTAAKALARRRARGEPVARLTGWREFWGIPFALSQTTLVPRPESETLVEAVLEFVASRRDDRLRLLDLGTGSGCILLALLSELPAAEGIRDRP